MKQKDKPEEFPKPAKLPETPGKDVPDTPFRPEPPGIPPVETPGTNKPPQEVPAPPKSKPL